MNTSPTTLTRTRPILCILAAILASGATLPAQTANPAPTASAAPATPAVTPAISSSAVTKAEDVIELSPFTVNAEEDVGYQAQNTLSGSRLNSSLKDTPGVLDVLTSEFLADIGVTSIEDALAYSANFAVDNGDFDSQGVINTVFPGSQANSSFRTRGLGGSVARNYLSTDFRPSFYTTERIDNSSGPNAILFGLGSAGGVANISTKQAKLNKDAYGLDFRVDSYGSKRATIDVNQVLIPKTLGLRVNAITSRGKKYRANFEDNSDGAQFAAKWKLSDRTEIRVEYELEHITGSVAYPGPHLEQVTNWIALGSGVAVLPANWETLSDTARRLVSTPLGLTTNGAGLSPVVVQQPNGQAYIINQATAITTTTTIGGTNSQSINPLLFSPQGNINGPGGHKGVDRQILSLAIDHKLADKLYLNFATARESGEADTYQAFANGAASGALIQVDANDTISNASQISPLAGPALTTNAAGRVVNPYAGQYYTQTRWLHRTQHNERKVAQLTLAYEADFGKWLGSHRMVTTTSYMETASGSENYRDSWLGAPFNADPVNTNNGVTRRRYASPLDAENFHVPDWRDFPVLSYNHPTRGTITTGWVTEGENLKTARQFAYLGAVQSKFFNRRLVVTAGYRKDRILDYVFGQSLTFPTGFEASTGIKVLDRNNVAKSETRGATHSLGGVFHITNWLSAYANTSTNFGPPRGTTVGPDAVVGPTTKGKGLDTGLKFSLLDNKIAIDVGYFDTSSNNVTEVLNLNLRTADSIAGAYNAVFTALRTPVGTTPLFNPADPAAVAALAAAYPLLRPTFNATGDLLDQASRGYEVRITANPIKGLNIRATFSKTSRDRENLYQFTVPMAAQLRTYVGALQAKNPGVNVSGLVATTDTTTTIGQSLDNLDLRLDLATDNNSSNFGAGKTSFNIVTRYDLPGRLLKGWSTSLTTSYQAGAYTGIYEVREGGVATGALLDTVPLFGKSIMNYGLGLRYKTRLGWLNKTSLTLQANVFNLLDQTEPIIRRASKIIIAPGAPTPTAVDAATKSYFLRDPRSWAVSASFDF